MDSNPRIERISFISQQLLWPATAGNVIWSLLSILIDPHSKISSRPEDIAALSSISLYMALNWTRRLHFGKRDESIIFIFLDLAHILCVCLLSLAIYYQSFISEISLLAIFGIASFTHFSGLAPSTKEKNSVRIVFGVINGAGILLWSSWSNLFPTFTSWNVAGPLITTVASWLIAVRLTSKFSPIQS